MIAIYSVVNSVLEIKSGLFTKQMQAILNHVEVGEIGKVDAVVDNRSIMFCLAVDI